MEGEKGIGKTMAVTEVCAKTDTAMVAFSCSSGTTMGDILGREHLYNGNSVFQLGVLPIAILTANKSPNKRGWSNLSQWKLYSDIQTVFMQFVIYLMLKTQVLNQQQQVILLNNKKSQKRL